MSNAGKISDFNDADRWVVESALKERYGHIVNVEIAEDKYRSQFYYSVAEQYGTGRDFDELAACVSVTLKLQADHEKDRAGATSGKTGAELTG